MSQVSRPFQVALVSAVAFLGVWFFALRPKTDGGSSSPRVVQPAPAPASQAPESSFGRAVQKARDARSQVEGAPAAKTGTATAPQTAARPAPTAPQRRATPGGPPPDRLARALAHHKALVVLFYSPRGADDRAVRSALAAVPRRGGRVVTAAVPIAAVSRYGAVTRGVRVVVAPTVLIYGRDGSLHNSIVGFTDAREIDQGVTDALAGR